MQKSSKKTRIMGILNITSNSFFDGGKYFDLEKSVKRAEDICFQGADIIDVGAESTRPFSEPVPLDEEMSVLEKSLPSIIKTAKKHHVLVSVDTYKSQVAELAVNLGADIINDIGGGDLDNNMFGVIAKFKPYYICGHIKGSPKDMQENPVYTDVVSEVKEDLLAKAGRLIDLGLPAEKIFLDPGIGFGKSYKDNLLLIKRINGIRKLGFPVVMGLSRKGFIRKISEIPGMADDFDSSLFGSLGANIFSALNGADIIRVHDVRETNAALRVVSEINLS